jgi:hypothetical protein
MRFAPYIVLSLPLTTGCIEPHSTTSRDRCTLPPATAKAKPPAAVKAKPPAAVKAKPSLAKADPLRRARLDRFASTSAFRGYLDRVREARTARRAARHVALGTDASGVLGLIGNQVGSSYGVGGLGIVGTGKGGGGTGEGTIGLGTLGTIGKGGGGGTGAGYGRGAGRLVADDHAGASITNNQEVGVDEGDIVKAAGDFLVILRRGRLFSVRRRDDGGPTLRPVGRCDACPRGATRGTWYDEMLVHGRRIVVIGYSYRVRATEVGLFRLGENGRIHHQATHFLRSNDYYSSRNYTSRLVGDRLLFYLPYRLRLPRRARGSVELPAIASWDVRRRNRGDWRTILREVDIYGPVQRTLFPVLHTVVACDLASPKLRCSARAVIGPFSRSFYVSPEAVYVWVGGWGRGHATLYRMPLADGGEVTAVRTRGQPVDQLSFKESADGHINVLLTPGGGGDWMFGAESAPSGQGGVFFGAERARSRLALLRLPLWTFAAAPMVAPEAAYTALPGGERALRGYALHNRFVGDWLLWGEGAGWWRRAENGGALYATHLEQPDRIQRLPLDHGVDRIEAMGSNAVAVGSGKADLFFSAVALGADSAPSGQGGVFFGREAAVRNTWVRKNAAQGETRTHGFFFLPASSGGGGTLGLPVRFRGRPGRHLWRGSAEVVFLRVSDALRFTPLGALTARGGRINDRCRVSCVDWYGNARPIFIDGRVLALLGYELVEGALDGDRLYERARVRFLWPR